MASISVDGMTKETPCNGAPRSKHSCLEHDKLEPVAVIGFSFKFPQDATSGESFWKMLLEGRSAMTEIPKDRFNIDAFYHPNADRHDTMNGRGGHFLKDDIAAFDAPFFSMPPAEAACVDPQQRSLLESTYHALENAGIRMEEVAGSKTSVHVGSFSREYETLFARDPELQAKYQATGTGTAMLANRLSWFYDLRGPSISLDTACSSSLNALHLSCQGLRSHESSMGLVCGSNLILNPETNMIPLSNMNFLSPDSKCYSFDHRANGYARGEGTGVIVIKLLARAIEDGNTIRAVIRATGSNQDGRTPGITQPSKSAQEAMIRETYATGGLDTMTTRYFEAHGTGTPVGDPIEAIAISAVFKDQRVPTEPLLIGAVKSNIGHLEGAAGLAGLIKTILILEKGIIPPNIWFERPNPLIKVSEWNIKFPIETTPWPTSGLRRASVNSFGYGGTNAHAVLDDAYNYLSARGIIAKHNTVCSPPRLGESFPSKNALAPNLSARGSHGNGSNGYSEDGQPKVFIWSASEEGGLQRLAATYQEHLLKAHNYRNGYLDSLAYTLSNKRSNLPWKSFFVARSVSNLQDDLVSKLSRPVRSSLQNLNLGFVFTGQGAQWHAMGRELFAYPTFRESLYAAQNYMHMLGSEWSLTDELFESEKLSNVHDPAYGQPLCTALQIALVELLSDWNIAPIAVVGHSSGEIAAAYCAGGLSRESAWKIAFYRGVFAARLARKTSTTGSMAVVALSESSLRPFLAEITAQLGPNRLVIGCANSPTNNTVTGDKECIDALKVLMDKENVYFRKLQVNVAYHSAHMNAIASEYLGFIKDLYPMNSQPAGKEMPIMISSVTGHYIRREHLSQSEYWVKNMVSKVKFREALSQMCSNPLLDTIGIGETTYSTLPNYLVEIGPHSALRRPINETLNHISKSDEIGYGTALVKGVSALQSSLQLAGQLRCRGCRVDLVAVNSAGVEESRIQILTDLPEYVFNHSQRYWLESSLSSNFRFRKFGRHELLGLRANDWNRLEGKWRNIIRHTENPWILDHKFNGSEIYPAAGMIVMAIEAARQVASSSLRIKGYKFQDVVFHKALLISLNPEGVETHLYLRPRNGSSNIAEWNDFRLYTYSNEEWAEVCQGTIITHFFEGGLKCVNKASQRSVHQSQASFAADVKKCRRSVDSKELYENLDSYGYNFGPSFQTLNQISFSDEKEAAATIGLHDWKTKIPDDLISDHLIHPTALDAIFHLTVAAFSKGGWEQVPTMVPTQLKSMWISNHLLDHSKNRELKLYAKPTFHGYREVEFSVFAFDPMDDMLAVSLEGYRGTAISSMKSSMKEAEWRRLCFNIDWKPDLETLSDHQISTYCASAVRNSESLTTKLIDESELVCLYFLSTVLHTLSTEQFQSSRTHVTRYLEWAKHHYDRCDAGTLLSSNIQGNTLLDDKAYRDVVLTGLKESGPDGKLYVTVGESLMPILRGEIDPLELLFNGPLVRDFYSSAAFVANYNKIAAYVDLLAHKNPDLKVLEIGAGTGGATAYIIQKLSMHGDDEKGVPRFSEYIYTDISPGFFVEAQKRFSEHVDRIVYRTLDIEKDPLQQGFEVGAYDVVVAAGVLHATADINNALQNTRKLLKPGGKLILFEPSNVNCSRIPFVFGLLPGWWLGTAEQNRYWGPLLSDQQWHYALEKANFSGATICLPDYRDHRHTFSTIISTAQDTRSVSRSFPNTVIISEETSSVQSRIALQTRSQLQELGVLNCEIVSPQKIHSQDLTRVFCIYLLEIDHNFLYEIQEDEFQNFKATTRSASGILWLTRGGGELASRPQVALVTGLGRSLRSENSHFKFVELALEDNSSIADAVQHIMKVYQKTLITPSEEIEPEYMEKDGLLYINRVVEANDLNDKIHSKVAPQKAKLQKLQENPEIALKLTISSPGLLDTLHFVDDRSVEREPLDEEVEIEVKAIGVNFKDVMVAMGQLPANSLGLECSGIISRVGHDVMRSQLKPGDRVCCIAEGAYKTLARTHAAAVSKISNDMSFSLAAAIPLVFCTAYYAIVHLANLKKDESILIHSGAGGVGQAAIQLAKMLKANIYVTVGNEEKKKLLMDLYHIPEDHFFSSRNERFAEKLKKITTGGVDVVLNSLSGERLRQSWNCIAPFGRFIELGKSDIEKNESLPMSPFSQNVLFASVDLSLIFKKSKSLMKQLMTSVMNLVIEEQIHTPQPLRVCKASEVEEAFRFLQNGKHSGKTVVELHEDDIVPVVPSTKPKYYFDSNATYVIAGGFGGLGRSICRWMVERRAKNLIVLSRSGARNEVALDLIEEARAKGVMIAAPACDISNEEALLSALQTCTISMPPIKGCIQGSMVLKDGLFENMSLRDFRAAIHPKAQGSWNLHVHLPKNMDFFILLSSTGGVIGSRGQSNYAAGNTYQDALARHRVALGLKGIALDLGLVLSVGFAAERREITESLKQLGYRGIREAEFLAMLEYLCDPALDTQSPLASQIVTGLESPKSMKSKGLVDALYWARKPLFRSFALMDGVKNNSSRDSDLHIDYETLFKSTNSQLEAARIISQALVEKLSKSLLIPREDIDTLKPIHAFGVDSLVAVEIRYWFIKEIKAELSIFNIMGNDSLAALSHLAAGKSQYLQHLHGTTEDTAL